MAKITDAVDPGNAGGSVLIPEIPTEPNRPVTFMCDKCGEIFVDPEARRQHVFDQHPFKRPQLLIGSRMVKERDEVVASPFPAGGLGHPASRAGRHRPAGSDQPAGRSPAQRDHLGLPRGHLDQ